MSQVRNKKIQRQSFFIHFETDNPLSCGCDLVWILTNATYYDLLVKAYAVPTCEDGTPISEIDGDALISHCSNQ